MGQMTNFQPEGMSRAGMTTAVIHESGSMACCHTELRHITSPTVLFIFNVGDNPDVHVFKLHSCVYVYTCSRQPCFVLELVKSGMIISNFSRLL